LADVELRADRRKTIGCQFSCEHHGDALPERIGHGDVVVRAGVQPLDRWLARG
jgi:hypothetical protein